MWEGLGRIGREVACRMQSFGMKIRVHVGGLERIGSGLQDGMKIRVHVGGAGEDRKWLAGWHEGQSSCGWGWEG